MDIDGKLVILRGPAGKLASPDAPNTGTWASLGAGWRGVEWGGPDMRHRAAKQSDGDYIFINEAHNCIAGADGGPYSPALDKQMYYKPTGNTDAGALERWKVYDGNANGAIEAQIEQLSEDGKPMFVCPLAVEIIPE